MEVAKTFDRNGIRYRPGDALPPDLDTTTLAHYRRHGMVREARTPAPAVKKPAARKPQAVAKPLEEKTATADSAAQPFSRAVAVTAVRSMASRVCPGS